jgi:maleamate amidohydrolase
MTSMPWEPAITQADVERYEAAGFGQPGGMGRRPALLIIDVQYRTVGNSPKPFFEALEDYRTACGETGWQAVDKIKRLLAHFRAHKLPVLYPYVSPKTSHDGGRLAGKVPAIMGVAERGYDFVEEIAPDENAILVPKKHPSAFFGTPLVSYLIDAGVDSLVITGCTTSGCVRATAVDAFAYNYHVTVPHDAVYDRTETVHQVNLFDMAQKYADVLSADDTVSRLDRQSA